jgi:hypothetical protein
MASPLVEAFLVFEQPRQRLGHWMSVVAPLDTHKAPALAGVAAYYDPSCDQALIGLRYDELALGPERLAFVIEVALLAELGMVQPQELAQGDRKRFLVERLSRCSIQVTDQRSVGSALQELVRLIKETRAAPRTVVAPSKGPPPIPLTPRGSTRNPVLLTSPKGTRDDLRQIPVRAKSTRDVEPARPRSTSPHVIPRSQLEADAAPTVVRPRPPTGPQPIIYARYLRSGRWVPVRIGALSLKGAALLTGALPRVHDYVDVAFTFAGHRALVRGAVAKVSSMQEASTTGAATFSVSFVLDDASRKQLTQLLTAARAANVTIKPPPPRATRRFPVEWPVAIGTNRGTIRGDALDVSHEGLFVRTTVGLELDGTVTFTAVLDDAVMPIAGRAQVVRAIGDEDAQVGGLVAGFGLHILDMAPTDRARWTAFLSRIERRADKRVLIGAAPARLAELQAALAAAGYAVTGGTDPGALVQLASAETRPVDAALIDAGWLAPGATATWVESLFSARNVPCLTMDGDSRRARSAMDKLLLVV